MDESSLIMNDPEQAHHVVAFDEQKDDVPAAQVDPNGKEHAEGQHTPIFVKADEIDETGADITISESVKDANISDFAENQSIDVPVTFPKSKDEVGVPTPVTRTVVPTRPQLRRETSTPAPPQQPPPPPAAQSEPDLSHANDSLSLMQLKKLVVDMPKGEATAYAFTYEDTASFAEELEEWFTYSDEEREDLLHARQTFEKAWETYISRHAPRDTPGQSWIEVDPTLRRKFVVHEVAGLEHPDVKRRGASLEALLYIGLGLWYETGGAGDNENQEVTGSDEKTAESRPGDSKHSGTEQQLKWMRIGAEAIYDGMGVQAVFDVMRGACLRAFDPERQDLLEQTKHQEFERRELADALTLMYLLVEVSRQQISSGNGSTLRDELTALDPNFLIFLVKILAKIRWDDSADVPLTKILLLFWKSLLLFFGTTKDVIDTKFATEDDSNRTSDEHGQPLLTASPLDYHLFRQEITSKYPAYNPPPPLLPLELENNSILPPLANHPSRNTSNDGLFSGIGPVSVNGGGSILHQPVHIATPAPSPPPSPAGPGGKAGKKQNYQTNQNFPFLYPPLDDSSNWASGKRSAVPQERLGNQRWDGSDIPTSILEAGTLFASRMRMTRAMRQLWQERQRYMKYERGWAEAESDENVDQSGSSTSLENWTDQNDGLHWDRPESKEIKRRLAAVEEFYRNGMPYLQSLVIVLLKAVLPNVTSLIPQASNGISGVASGLQSQEVGNGNGTSQAKPKVNGNNGRQVNGATNEQSDNFIDFSDSIPEELEVVRAREITAKAVSGLLLLLLKWFKISHILKYEYLTQLLLDSSYLPLILKLFAHQELERVIDSKSDRDDRSERQEIPESDNDACPPPIPRQRKEQQQPVNHSLSPESMRPPEVDELGNPTTELPSAPITSFSWRNFFSSINFLRIMQKICKGKAHRNLLLVQYKSSTYLKKNLKVPQPDLRLYTLKLFKNQVPYCGRKWRQTNMRVITAVYLQCRPELRDDWLAGSDVDAEVEEALPLEQALRALTHWHNLKRYPEQMGAQVGILEQEQDFFLRELEKMDWGEEVAEGEEAPVPPEGWEGPLQMEGW
ncbi:MAG: Factor arrest protein 11 [Candelina mexicana]|nr:MAG: Factor arrest protein 11 [Candelina mexicana]